MDPLPIIMDAIHLKEVYYVIEKLRIHKAASENKITDKLLKIRTHNNLERLCTLYNEIWTVEKIPQDWK